MSDSPNKAKTQTKQQQAKPPEKDYEKQVESKSASAKPSQSEAPKQMVDQKKNEKRKKSSARELEEAKGSGDTEINKQQRKQPDAPPTRNPKSDVKEKKDVDKKGTKKVDTEKKNADKKSKFKDRHSLLSCDTRLEDGMQIM